MQNSTFVYSFDNHVKSKEQNFLKSSKSFKLYIKGLTILHFYAKQNKKKRKIFENHLMDIVFIKTPLQLFALHSNVFIII